MIRYESLYFSHFTSSAYELSLTFEKRSTSAEVKSWFYPKDDDDNAVDLRLAVTPVDAVSRLCRAQLEPFNQNDKTLIAASSTSESTVFRACRTRISASAM